MSFTENLYLKREIQQLQEENKQLRKVLNEARIRKGNLPEPDGRLGLTAMRNRERSFMTADALTALVDPKHGIHKKENQHIKDSIIRVLGDMRLINVEGSNTDRRPADGIPAAEGGPGTGTANREDMENFIKFSKTYSRPDSPKWPPRHPAGFYDSQLRDRPES